MEASTNLARNAIVSVRRMDPEQALSLRVREKIAHGFLAEAFAIETRTFSQDAAQAQAYFQEAMQEVTAWIEALRRSGYNNGDKA